VDVLCVTVAGVERMTRDEVGLALGWAASEGWNPGLHDAEAFLAADPQGFFVFKVDGQPVATLSAVRYGEGFGFLGLYITAPDKRGRGYGLGVWRAGRAHLAGRVVGLDAVLEQEKTYARDGFVADHRTTRYILASTNSLPPAHRLMVDARELPLETLAAYDRHLFPSTRSTFLAAWITMPDALSLAVMEGDQVLGWGVRRSCIEGHKVGPLFADDSDIANDLFCALATGVAGPLYLDIPDPNAAGGAFAARHDMTPVFSTVRMYDGPPPALDLQRIFGVTTLEVG
jgi:Acetyltransferase (GNAT) domain